MNINFLYSVIVNLCFTVQFDVNDNSTQNYFIFDGDDATAHLRRYNKTISLFLQWNTSYRHLEMENISNQFVFEWQGYKINNEEMKIVRSVGDWNLLGFDIFTFISPTLNFVEEEAVATYGGPLIDSQDINYGIFVLIVFGVGLLLKFDIIAPKVFERIIKSYAPLQIEEMTDV